MKTKQIKVMAGMTFASIALVIALVSSCKKDDVITPLTSTDTPGSLVIDATVGSTPPASYTSGWYLDKAHSNVMWETQYYESNALLTGRFNMFNMYVKFDEATPANTTVKAWVQLSTFNTGETGRDSKGKCGPGYMGITYLDTLYTVNPATDTAWFNSTSCKKYGDGYLVKGDFKFRGKTASVDMYMTATEKTTVTNATSGKKNDKIGLEGAFTIKANSVFGVNSTSINDDVTIRANCNLRTKEY